jgi:hypothetical protein
MKTVLWLLAIAALAPIVLLGGWIGAGWLRAELTEVDRRFRLAIEIDTSEGVRAGSSVIRVTRPDYGWMPLSGISKTNFAHKVEGEAAFVPLPGDKHVIALLAHGATGQDSDRMISLWSEAYLGWNRKWDETVWSGDRRLEGVVELQLQQIPTLITFTDIADPASAKGVFAGGRKMIRRVSPDGKSESFHAGEPKALVDAFAETFGPGFAFRRATIEMAPKDTPVTRGIEKRFPVIMGKLRELDKTMQLVHPKDPFKARSGHLSIP